MDRALTELAEATVGLNSELRWSMSDDITRRQMEPVFSRCASGDLTPEQALDVCVDCMTVKIVFINKIFDNLYNRLVVKLTEEFGDTHFQAMTELQEFFMGLDDTNLWAVNEEIFREEMLPCFVRCSEGRLGPQQALNIFVDNVSVKRQYMLSLIQDRVRKLAQEINADNGASVRVDDEES